MKTYNVKVIMKLPLCQGDTKHPVQVSSVALPAIKPEVAAWMAHRSASESYPRARVYAEVRTDHPDFGIVRHACGDVRLKP